VDSFDHRKGTPSPSRASRQDATEYYRLDASSNSPRPRCRTEEALDQASSAASAHGNDGGSQPLPRRSLGGDRGAGGRAVASETRRRSGAATGEARSRGGAHGVAAQGREVDGGWTPGRYFIYRPPPWSLKTVGLVTYGPDFKQKHPDLVVFLPDSMDRATALPQGAAVSPPASRASAAAGDPNKAALDRC